MLMKLLWQIGRNLTDTSSSVSFKVALVILICLVTALLDRFYYHLSFFASLAVSISSKFHHQDYKEILVWPCVAFIYHQGNVTDHRNFCWERKSWQQYFGKAVKYYFTDFRLCYVLKSKKFQGFSGMVVELKNIKWLQVMKTLNFRLWRASAEKTTRQWYFLSRQTSSTSSIDFYSISYNLDHVVIFFGNKTDFW